MLIASALTLFLAATPLTDAIKTGDKATVLRLVSQRADVNTPEPDGTTALHWAAQRNDLELVDRLLKAGAKANVRNDYGATPLSEAAIAGNAAMIAKLLEAGADVESANADGQSALMLVARTGNVAAATLLIMAGANVNAREAWHQQTAVMWAAAQRQPEMVRLLVQSGADVNAVSKANNWQRQVSAEPRALWRPAGGLTPLLFAAREGCVECGTRLIEAGADVNLSDPEGVTPLVLSIFNMNFDFASMLLDKGANFQKWDVYGRTPLYVAVDMNTIPNGGRPDGPSLDATTSLQLIQRLLDMGANPNPQTRLMMPMRNVVDDRSVDRSIVIGATPLLRAAKALDAPVVALLLRHGANVHLANIRQHTPVMVAAGLASVDADTRGRYTTSDVQQRSIATLTLLLDAGADVNGKESTRGLTALHEAARWGWNDVIRFLVTKGADVKAVDARGMTPVDSALGRAGGNSKFADRIDVFPETAALLKSYGGVEGTPVNQPTGPALAAREGFVTPAGGGPSAPEPAQAPAPRR